MNGDHRAKIAAALADLRRRIETAVRGAADAADRIEVIAVSKRHPCQSIALAHSCGQRDFGENYAVEFANKASTLEALADIRWHFIGQLQRNKVIKVVGRAALIHAVDSERLLREIERRATLADCRQAILIAVSLAGEEKKSGATVDDAAELVRLAQTMERLECRGLMTMPPLAEHAEDSRPFFSELRRLRDSLASAAQPLRELSMGTTADFEVAAREGATYLRIGTAIFGPRPLSPE